jgi:hypothetical protein
MLTLLLLGIMSYQNAAGVTHPHIIVNESEYPNLQIRSENWPWSVMKEKAIYDAKNLNHNPGVSYSGKCTRTHDIASACALAYILDVDNRSIYMQKVETQLAQAIDYIRTEKGSKSDHAYHVDSAHAAFMMYLVLDVMYNDLSPTIRQAMEDDCDFIAANHRSSWRSSEFSIKGMMELYHNGKTASFESIKNDYRDYILSLTSDDGVYTTGPGYTNSRVFMDSRMQKKIFMDICEYQRYHEFYSDPKFQNLYEWIFGYSVTPFNRSYTFGDSPPTKSLDHWAVSALRSNRFSDKAQRYATWQLGPLTDDLIKGGLLHYILCDSIPKPALRPQSRIFKNGGVCFIEDSDSDLALFGALWNINTEGASHNHKDVNAIHIAAYGEHVLRNSGYDGWEEPDLATWKWIHETAQSSNTLTLNHQNHASSFAGGITESMLGGDLEYASGSSGSALVLGSHQRNFIFIKPKPFTNGYFLIIDEVKGLPFFDNANISLHPNSYLEPSILAENKQYQWEIKGCNYSGHPVFLTVFLGTPPVTAEIKTGYVGSYEECSRFEDKYLYTTYALDENAKSNMVTVLFPHDDSHPIADLRRIQLQEATGARIEHEFSIIDYALESHSKSTIDYQNISFAGRSTVWRDSNQNNQFYFVRQGNLFRHNTENQLGFQSDSLVSILFRDRIGKIVSPGTNVMFFYPDINGIKLNGNLNSVLESGQNWLKVYIPEGESDLEIISSFTSVQSKNSPGVTAYKLFQNFPNPFNNSTVIYYRIPFTEKVDLNVYNLSGQVLSQLVDGIQAAGSYRAIWNADGLPRVSRS